jgi:hypothetical protein
MLAEGLHRQPVQRLGQGAAAHQGIGEIEGDAFFCRQDGFQVGDQAGQPLGRLGAYRFPGLARCDCVASSKVGTAKGLAEGSASLLDWACGDCCADPLGGHLDTTV